jgi:mRNA interferase MazF
MREIKHGQVWMVELKPMGGSIQYGKRPAIIISNDKNNQYSPTINIIPLTSKKSKRNIPVHVHVTTECGVTIDSVALVEQTMTIDKTQLISYLGECTKEVKMKIMKAINIQHQCNSVMCIQNFANKFTSQYFRKEEVANKIKDKLILELQKHCEKYNIDYVMLN